MKPDIERLRKKYIDNPSEGMTSGDICRMSEDDPFDDDFGEESFYIFYSGDRPIVVPKRTFTKRIFGERTFLFKSSKIGISYKVKKHGLFLTVLL